MPVRDWAVRLSTVLGSSAVLTAVFATACSGNAVNGGAISPSHSPVATLAAGATVPWADIPAPLASQPQPPIPDLVVVLNVPPTVRAGEDLRYEVTVGNGTKSLFSWTDGCPVFLATLQTPGPEPKNVTGNHQQLNCAPARDLQPEEKATFEMRLAIPGEVPAGPWILNWSFTAPGAPASPPAKANLTIQR